MNAEEAKRIWASRQIGVPVEKITGVTEELVGSGYCETCYYEEINIVVRYTRNGKPARENLYYTFNEILDDLLQIASEETS